MIVNSPHRYNLGMLLEQKHLMRPFIMREIDLGSLTQNKPLPLKYGRPLPHKLKLKFITTITFKRMI